MYLLVFVVWWCAVCLVLRPLDGKMKQWEFAALSLAVTVLLFLATLALS